MVKKLQALRAKKGFTLVELIVVIAIIGVLAAILVPTLLGVVTKSRVTSADSTAASIRTTINSFLTDADAAGYGMKAVVTNETTITASVISGAWTVNVANPDMFKKRAVDGGDMPWAGSANATPGATVPAKASPTLMLAQNLADTFPDMTRATIYCAVVGGQNCVFAAYTADDSDIGVLTNEVSGMVSGSTVNKTDAWDGKNAGIGKNTGYTIGTAPKVNKD